MRCRDIRRRSSNPAPSSSSQFLPTLPLFSGGYVLADDYMNRGVSRREKRRKTAIQWDERYKKKIIESCPLLFLPFSSYSSSLLRRLCFSLWFHSVFNSITLLISSKKKKITCLCSYSLSIWFISVCLSVILFISDSLHSVSPYSLF